MAWGSALSLVALGGGFLLVSSVRVGASPRVGPFGALFLLLGLLGCAELLRSNTADSHELKIQSHLGRYWAECDCGFEGIDRPTRGGAVADARLHSPLFNDVVAGRAGETIETLGFALVSREILDLRRPVGVMYREDTVSPGDSGWRIYSGLETGGFLKRKKNLVTCPMARVLAVDASIAPYLLETPPCAFERPSLASGFRTIDLAWHEEGDDAG